MKKLSQFVSEHISDDPIRLLLDRKKWPEIDMDIAVECIESRRKLKGKVQEWYENPDLIFPRKLSAEQCSSSATGLYKASLAKHIIGESKPGSFRIADLTGGLGVDSWFFSMKAGKVLYNEMQTPLYNAASHNFYILESGNILLRNRIAEKGRYPCSLTDSIPTSYIWIRPEEEKVERRFFLSKNAVPMSSH
jgi:hypothetical protein